MDTLTRLTALEDIRTLRIKYAHLLDTFRIDRLDEVFTADAIVDAGRGQWNGLDAAKQGLAEAFRAFSRDGAASPYPFHHAITNHWIEFVADDRAEGRCYLLDLQTDPAAERWILLGTYADEYRAWPVAGASPAPGSTSPGRNRPSAAGCRGTVWSCPAERPGRPTSSGVPPAAGTKPGWR